MTQNPFPPVPLKPRHDGWTPDKQWRFVEALAATGSITQAARAVMMSVRSAQRLRRHPLAGDFRSAWDAALQQVWGGLEQVALDRVMNGERETIERGGYLVVERWRPCSDRLLIHMLNMRERTLAAERAERAAAHQRAMATHRLAEMNAVAEMARSRGGKARAAAAAAMPEPPRLASDLEAETAALAAFHRMADEFAEWPTMADEPIRMLEEPEPVDAEAAVGGEAAAPALAGGDAGPVVGSGDAGPAVMLDAMGEPYDYATRPRWEDYRAAELAAAESAKTANDATFATF